MNIMIDNSAIYTFMDIELRGELIPTRYILFQGHNCYWRREAHHQMICHRLSTPLFVACIHHQK